MNRVRATCQRGQALLLMLMVLAMGSTWYLVSRLNAESGAAVVLRKERNNEVLNRAKQVLIGYIAAQANKSGENRPGAFPCPEAPANFNDPSQTGSDGTVSYPCTLPIVGRFPWKTIGVDKLVDVTGEPLWYAIASGWAGANTVINSDCASPASGMACATGRLTVDGVTNDVIALIIAPGPAVTVAASAGCAAWQQTRPTVAPPDWRNYLECENASSPVDATFVTRNANSAFNDQFVTITVADVLPGIEAAIANRIEREIAPQLQTVFAGPNWGLTAGSRLYPFAAPFANPGPGAGTSNYAGSYGTYAGLLPFNQVDCTASASNPRCLPGAALTSWATTPTAYDGGGWGYIQTQSCWWESGNAARVCEGEYHENDTYPANPGMRIEMEATLRNVAMGLRRFDTTRLQVSARNDGSAAWISQAVGYAVSLSPSDGSVTIRFWSDLPNIDSMGWGTWAQYRIRIERLAITDHALLDTTDGTTGWFARNEWFRQTYYAVAPGYTVTTQPPACTTGTNCLTVANVTPAGAQRAILILGGRSLNGSVRPDPTATLANYLEAGNATGAYTRQTVSTGNTVPVAQRFNDRIVVVDRN
jgi:hypothetical protein